MIAFKSTVIIHTKLVYIVIEVDKAFTTATDLGVADLTPPRVILSGYPSCFKSQPPCCVFVGAVAVAKCLLSVMRCVAGRGGCAVLCAFHKVYARCVSLLQKPKRLVSEVVMFVSVLLLETVAP